MDENGEALLTETDLTDAGMIASDNCTAEEDISISIGQSMFDCTNLGGSTNVTITYADESENETTCDVSIQVIDSSIFLQIRINVEL